MFFPLHYAASNYARDNLHESQGNQNVHDKWGASCGAEVMLFCVVLADLEKVERRH